ncbi:MULTISPECIES: CHASE2 domain-containing protein [unclassified Nostoc]|uniref:CHASE2 domain-containing protein n=1 Tax=unclassified Nostoc TaxID=2593658 RepID=UPI002AD36D8B|nr:CHASE2 domain-containing protein [Nostoc sp. DedQUE03]MDZ7971791.1 CHASE2 domain-containing protein [Nostoc sp. DedQUE03]MDZ8049026.1 CHASE2 domain-containing protein [Nostoc sp. DedQUE02]
MSKIQPEVANRRIESFKKRFGKAHLYLVYHAAFPLALTPDLLYRLWANFQRDIHGQVLNIPWVSVADMLLSSLCNKVGYELYEMDLPIRKELLKCLKEDPHFGKQRLDELANFLLDYIHPQLRNDDPNIQDLAQAQRWAALAYVLPRKAVRELAFILSKLDQNRDQAEILRLASLVETVGESLAEFEPLLIYTRGMRSLIRGDLESAKAQFTKATIYQKTIQIAGINLLVPEEIIKVTAHSINDVSRLEKQKVTTSIIKIFSTQTASRQKLINNSETSSSRLNFSRVIFVSLLITGFVTGIRFLGILENTEISAYDQMMRSRPAEGLDPRLLIITIDDEDLAIQRQNGESLSGSYISEKSLNKLLAKVNQYKPRAIGLDIYRDYKAKEPDLITRLQQTQNLVGLCKGSDSSVNIQGIQPPPEIPTGNLGFSDFIHDRDGVIRRHLLFMNQETTSLCSTPYSFSLQLASFYMRPLGIQTKFTPEGNLQLGKTIFENLKSRTGGYQNIDANGGQILLNYRSSKEIAEQVKLTQFLSSPINPSAIKDRIVIIGVVAKGDSPDTWPTPYGISLDEQMPGLLVQAHMVSQILSAVQDGRPLLRAWSWWAEVAWIWGWSLIGGVLAWRRLSLPWLLFAIGVTSSVLYILCFGLFISGAWVPFVPSALSLVAMVSLMSIYNNSKTKVRVGNREWGTGEKLQ